MIASVFRHARQTEPPLNPDLSDMAEWTVCQLLIMGKNLLPVISLLNHILVSLCYYLHIKYIFDIIILLVNYIFPSQYVVMHLPFIR